MLSRSLIFSGVHFYGKLLSVRYTSSLSKKILEPEKGSEQNKEFHDSKELEFEDELESVETTETQYNDSEAFKFPWEKSPDVDLNNEDILSQTKSVSDFLGVRDKESLIETENSKDFDFLLPWEKNSQSEAIIFDNKDFVDPSQFELILRPSKKKKNLLSISGTPSTALSSTENLQLEFERDFKTLMNFKPVVTSDQLFETIEEFKPSSQIITIKQLLDLTTRLNQSFKLSQLKEFLNEVCPGSIRSKRVTKKKVISSIISNHWCLKITSDTTQDLVEEIKIDLTHKRDLFLLLSNNGTLPGHWTLMGAKLSFGQNKRELVVRGSKNIVEFVQASWNELLNKMAVEILDLTSLKTFYDELGKKMQLEKLQTETGVYFDKFSDTKETYVLSALQKDMVRNAKVELLNATEYKSNHNKEVINLLNDEAEKLLKISVIDQTLPWYIKCLDVYRLSLSKERLKESMPLEADNSAEELSKEIEDLKLAVNEANEKFEYNYVEIGIKLKEDEKSNEKDFFNINGVEGHEDSPKIDELVKKLDFENLNKKLVNNEEFELKNDKTKLMLENIVNVKLGKILFDRNSENNSFFHSNIPNIIRNLGKLELFDKSSKLFGQSGGIRNNFSRQLHLKLIPNGFWHNKLENFKNFQEIEIIFDLTKGKVLKEDMIALMSEHEENIEIAMPQFDMDMKFQSSINSMMCYNKDDWILNGRDVDEFRDLGEDEANEVTLNKRSILKTLFQAIDNLDIKNDRNRLEIMENLKNKIVTIYLQTERKKKSKDKATTAKYIVSEVSCIKTIELDFKGSVVVFEVKDNGKFEKFEVSMLKDNNKKDETIEDFSKKSIELVEFLSR